MNRIRKKYNFDITTFVCCVAEIFTDISGPLDAWANWANQANYLLAVSSSAPVIFFP